MIDKIILFVKEKRIINWYSPNSKLSSQSQTVHWHKMNSNFFKIISFHIKPKAYNYTWRQAQNNSTQVMTDEDTKEWLYGRLVIPNYIQMFHHKFVILSVTPWLIKSSLIHTFHRQYQALHAPALQTNKKHLKECQL